jgi:hypothetical protein
MLQYVDSIVISTIICPFLCFFMRVTYEKHDMLYVEMYICQVVTSHLSVNNFHLDFRVTSEWKVEIGGDYD